MTPEQIKQSAQMIVMQYYRDSVQIDEIITLVQSAVEAEREACAQVADAFNIGNSMYPITVPGIAAAIRARS